jgi:site-specific DNA-methyltransferase (adenine-specific)
MSLLDFTDVSTSVEIRRQDAEELLGSLPAESVALVVTDPPYGISYQSNRRKDGKSAPIALDWNFQVGPFLNEVLRVLRPGGAAYIFTRWDVYPLWHRSIPPELALKNLIVWNKDNHSAGDLDGNFGFKWEAIMFLVKGTHKRRGRRWSNVWDHPRVSSKDQIHPAEKPTGLLQRAIEASSDPGDLVVDPFCGSGATGVAAVLSGRRALLGDMDDRVLALTHERFGLSYDPVGGKRKQEQMVDNNPSLCMDALEGVHPEDVAWLVEEFARRRA